MNKYESIIIINPNIDEAGLKALEEKLTGLINENGKVEEVISMGKRKLSYEIKKNKEAYYVQFNFESKPEAITELERIYRITDDVLKFITIKK
jgi:small subunit ribosomal protein S6